LILRPDLNAEFSGDSAQGTNDPREAQDTAATEHESPTNRFRRST